MKKFDDELEKLRLHVLEMGELAQSMVDAAVHVLESGDTSGSKEIYENEQRMDRKQLEVDREAIRLLTVYGPVATDLRFILSVTHITSELERVGDQAENMCEYLELIADRSDIPLISTARKMSVLVADMLRDAMAAFADRNLERAMVVIRGDNRVDALNDQVLQEMLSGDSNGGVRSISASLAVILIARALERMADQATNICEEVVYLVEGEDIRHSLEDEDK